MDTRKLDHEHAAPLLDGDRSSQDIELADFDGDLDGSLRRTSTHESHEPPIPAIPKDKTSYIAIGVVLLITVLGFMINTEATAYFEDILGWRKPFCTMYIMHSSLCLPWFCELGYSRWMQGRISQKAWFREYSSNLRELVSTIDAHATDRPRTILGFKDQRAGPFVLLAGTMAIVTVVLTVSGCSWFVSLAMTTPADLTAIYNCSTFFAAAFSVPLLHERLTWVAIAAVALSIIGTFVIAYGDTTAEHDASAVGTQRLVGNLIACVGAVAFGLYEVLFKKWACSSRPMAPSESLPLTFAASALTGIYTFATLWIGLLVLHFTGVETFVWPNAEAGLWIVIAVVTGSVSINCLVVLVVWTDPIFGSMANVLSVFFVALADWVVFGLSPSIATYAGGALIIVAFGLLAKDTLGEKKH